MTSPENHPDVKAVVATFKRAIAEAERVVKDHVCTEAVPWCYSRLNGGECSCFGSPTDRATQFEEARREKRLAYHNRKLREENAGLRSMVASYELNGLDGAALNMAADRLHDLHRGYGGAVAKLRQLAKVRE